MSRLQMRDDQGSNAMRDKTFSRRDMLWAAAALGVGAAFAGPPKAAASERPKTKSMSLSQGNSPARREDFPRCGPTPLEDLARY